MLSNTYKWFIHHLDCLTYSFVHGLDLQTPIHATTHYLVEETIDQAKNKFTLYNKSYLFSS